MTVNEVFLGSHLPMAAPDSYLGTCQLAYAFGENTFMFYTGAPQNTKRTPLNQLKIPEGRAFLHEKGFDESKIVVHAPYIINLANRADPRILDLAVAFLKEELKRVEGFGLSLLVLHPGSAVGVTSEEGIQNVAKGLNEVLAEDTTHVRICLETMAGKGHEVGRSFEELAAIISLVEKKERLGICLDTCHINDAGYDDRDVSGILDAFDKTIGLERLAVIHLNDSKNERDSHKDRHENIGYGTIGFDTLEKWVQEPRLTNIPKILETPAVGDAYPYKKEIEMLRSGRFENGWREKL